MPNNKLCPRWESEADKLSLPSFSRMQPSASERSLFKHLWPTAYVPHLNGIFQMPTTRLGGVRGLVCSHTAQNSNSLSNATCALGHCSKWTALDPDLPHRQCRMKAPGELPCLAGSLSNFPRACGPMLDVAQSSGIPGQGNPGYGNWATGFFFFF